MPREGGAWNAQNAQGLRTMRRNDDKWPEQLSLFPDLNPPFYRWENWDQREPPLAMQPPPGRAQNHTTGVAYEEKILRPPGETVLKPKRQNPRKISKS